MEPIDVLSRALDQTGDLLDRVHADVPARPQDVPSSPKIHKAPDRRV